MFIPFHKPYFCNDESEAVVDAIKGGWLTMGAKTFEFESLFAKYTNAQCSVAVNSCTAALHLALAAHGVGHGDEVIIPALTFVADAEVVRYLGAIPVFADVDPVTLCISPADVEKKITAKTKAVIAVHYGGQPADLDELNEICRAKKISLIEDAAHAFPASYKGCTIGSSENAVAFSFYATKTITTGEGGMLNVPSGEYAERIKRMRLHGIDRDAWKRYQKDGTWTYDVTDLGYKYNPTDISSAMGIEQLKGADEALSARKKIASKYDEAFSASDMLSVQQILPDRTSAYHLYPIRLNMEALNISRDDFINLMKENEIGTSVHYIPVYRFSYYRKMFEEHFISVVPSRDFPVTEDVFGRFLSIPIYPSLGSGDVERIIDTVLSILKKYKR